MILLPVSPEVQEQRDLLNKRMLSNHIELYIRKQFDNAATNLEAISWINVATSYGMMDLAIEMQTDLNNLL